ncbi:hypothetical protein A2U01_0111952, partial [Trifolium medium]|nr:hypothetical protein [Trifolium medium]
MSRGSKASHPTALFTEYGHWHKHSCHKHKHGKPSCANESFSESGWWDNFLAKLEPGKPPK